MFNALTLSVELAALDLGSNSFHLIIVRQNNGELRVVDRLNEYVRLAAGLDNDNRLERISDSLPFIELSLWVLTHPDLRNTARIRAMMAHLYEELGRDADLYAGERKKPERWNLLPR